jgi:hypothetical protein
VENVIEVTTDPGSSGRLLCHEIPPSKVESKSPVEVERNIALVEGLTKQDLISSKN